VSFTRVFAVKKLGTESTFERPLIAMRSHMNLKAMSPFEFLWTESTAVFGISFFDFGKSPRECCWVGVLDGHVFLKFFLRAETEIYPWAAEFCTAKWSLVPADVIFAT
jgi:hypothetical protein